MDNLRRRWVRAVAAAVFAVAVVVGSIVAGMNANPAQAVRLLSGAAWLPSSKAGQLALLDGSTAGGDLGAALEVADRLFVPDYPTGKVWIVDLAGRKVIAQPQILNPANRFQLLTRDGLVFYNDPASEKAGVIRLDGTVAATVKYDPADPDKGVDQPSRPTQHQPTSAASSPSLTRDKPTTPTVNEPITLTVKNNTGPPAQSAQWSFWRRAHRRWTGHV